jgi:hypothetical protein
MIGTGGDVCCGGHCPSTEIAGLVGADLAPYREAFAAE